MGPEEKVQFDEVTFIAVVFMAKRMTTALGCMTIAALLQAQRRRGNQFYLLRNTLVAQSHGTCSQYTMP